MLLRASDEACDKGRGGPTAYLGRVRQERTLRAPLERHDHSSCYVPEPECRPSNVRDLSEADDWGPWEVGECPVCGDHLRGITKSGELRLHHDWRPLARGASIDDVRAKVASAKAPLDEVMLALQHLDSWCSASPSLIVRGALSLSAACRLRWERAPVS